MSIVALRRRGPSDARFRGGAGEGSGDTPPMGFAGSLQSTAAKHHGVFYAGAKPSLTKFWFMELDDIGFHELTIFSAFAQHEHLGRAAEALGLSVPPFSAPFARLRAGSAFH
jgi:hypothetical protein